MAFLGKASVAGAHLVLSRYVRTVTGTALAPPRRAPTALLSRVVKFSRGSKESVPIANLYCTSRFNACTPLKSQNEMVGQRRGTRALSATPGPAAEAGKDESGTTADDQEDDPWEVKMLYDGDCPLCMREVDMLRGRNQQYGAIKFVDISSPDYSAEENGGVDFETAMGRIHAIQRDGSILTNVKAFRKFYEVVGLRWVYAITQYEPIGKIADAVYAVWAKYRLQITGMRTPIDVSCIGGPQIETGSYSM